MTEKTKNTIEQMLGVLNLTCIEDNEHLVTKYIESGIKYGKIDPEFVSYVLLTHTLSHEYELELQIALTKVQLKELKQEYGMDICELKKGGYQPNLNRLCELYDRNIEVLNQRNTHYKNELNHLRNSKKKSKILKLLKK